jgi:hypothetical protein
MARYRSSYAFEDRSMYLGAQRKDSAPGKKIRKEGLDSDFARERKKPARESRLRTPAKRL